MPVTLQDEHVTKLANFIAGFFVDKFTVDHLSPKDFVSEFDTSTKLFKGQIIQKASELWENKEDEVDGTLGFSDVYKLVKTADKSTPEEKLMTMLPEEKIIINQKAFREVLDSVSFENITPTYEKGLLNQLKTNSIGLNDQEIFIYYNLIKLSKSKDMDQVSNGSSEHMRLDASETVEEVISSLSTNIAPVEDLKNINEQKSFTMGDYVSAIENKIRTKKINATTLKLISGSYPENMIFINIMTSYISSVAKKWGTSSDEAFLYLVAYIIFNSCDDNVLENINLSRLLNNFINGEATKIKPIISVSIRFIYVFTTVLASQVGEINRKFYECSTEQKQKIIKLYAAKERRNMIIVNSAQFAFQKISDQRSEVLDTEKNFKSFMPKIISAVTEKVLFENEY